MMQVKDLLCIFDSVFLFYFGEPYTENICFDAKCSDSVLNKPVQTHTALHKLSLHCKTGSEVLLKWLYTDCLMHFHSNYSCILQAS